MQLIRYNDAQCLFCLCTLLILIAVPHLFRNVLDDVQEISESEIQKIKGSKVWKRFGRKKYLGDVVDYDPENKWFKVR